MAKIRRDKLGTYAKVGGYICRPIQPTQFLEGDTVVGKHFGGSQTFGIGKLPGRREYAEYWKSYNEEDFQFQGPWGEYY